MHLFQRSRARGTWAARRRYFNVRPPQECHRHKALASAQTERIQVKTKPCETKPWTNDRRQKLLPLLFDLPRRNPRLPRRRGQQRQHTDPRFERSKVRSEGITTESVIA